jgi:hypothetical protein
MKRLGSNLIIFFISLVLLYPILYWAYYKLSVPESSKACYIWGDSQINRGLDLAYLNKNSNYRFFSTAQDGAGIYDFLVFTELVPENSFVIISISRPVLLRRKALDRNVSAINIKCLNKLMENNYSGNEIFTIITKNLKPGKIFSQKNTLFENTDSMKIGEPMTIFEGIYKQKPAYFFDKKNLFLAGLKTLINKKCRIVAIVFPYHPILNEIESKSQFVNDLKRFDEDVSKFFDSNKVIEIKLKDNIFRDLTHLNERGARYLSKELIGMLDFKEQTLLIKVK